MSFTRAKNPVNDSGFELTNWRSSLGDMTGYTLFFVAILFSWNVAKNQGLPMFNGLVNSLTGGRLSGSTGGNTGWEGW